MRIHGRKYSTPDDGDLCTEDSNEEDADADWADDVNKIETAVLDHVSNPELATYLIRKLFNEFADHKAEAIGEGHVALNQCRGAETSGNEQNPEHVEKINTSNPRKRRERSGEDNSDDEIDHEEDGDNHRLPIPPGNGPSGISTIFTCPLFKWKPIVYCRGVNGEFFIPCQRGFKTLQRLK